MDRWSWYAKFTPIVDKNTSACMHKSTRVDLTNGSMDAKGSTNAKILIRRVCNQYINNIAYSSEIKEWQLARMIIKSLS